MSLDGSYSPQEFEKPLYEFWEGNSCFDAQDENAPGQESFAIMIPPPNVTGVLHMGHALTCTIQDVLVRWRRMHGDNALWLPGTDHAGIATQNQVEKALAKEEGPEGKPLTRHDIGREEFLKRTWKWKDDHHGGITNQLRRLGASVDWKRERFTMDEGCSRAVREVFVRLYEEGLIYRGERIINWCTRCQTALSDLEVVPNDRKGNLWHIRYPIVDDSGNEVTRLTIATTRPETLLGDTAVAIHPEDERYQNLKGLKAKVPLSGRLIPVILDEYVDREFGTGALKVTPAHDFNDFELGQKHRLEFMAVMGQDGRMMESAGEYAGLKFEAARKKVVEDLEAQGLLDKVEPHALKVGLCQRCDRVAEPVVSKQWFVKIAPLAKPAISAVETGKITFTPKNWEKTYFEWMYNIRDWCISRQLWWGHQIPAWYCGSCEEVIVAREGPSKCKCGGSNLTQDEDVLDTWFSSGLWPFATLGWPEETKPLKTFYPGTVMETGFDIIFFWVARMIMMGMHFMGEIPFKKVYLHAMVRDEKGQKMSKSKGNVIDPLEIADKLGVDPLRFTLAIMAGQGRDIKLSMQRVEGYRAFCNKLWNATKFTLMQEVPPAPEGGLAQWIVDNRQTLPVECRWILSRLDSLVKDVDGGLERFELNVATQSLYGFAWNEFCDWFIELSKLSQEGQDRQAVLYTLHYTLENLLKLLHPFIPFVTERLWKELPLKEVAGDRVESLMLQPFPKVGGFEDAEAETFVEGLKTVTQALRNFRGESGIAPKTEIAARFATEDESARKFILENEGRLKILCRLSALSEEKGNAKNEDAMIPLLSPKVELRVSLAGLVNFDEESKRLLKEIDKAKADVAHVSKKLNNPRFVEKAPEALVNKEREKVAGFEAKLKELEASLDRINKMSGKD